MEKYNNIISEFRRKEKFTLKELETELKLISPTGESDCIKVLSRIGNLDVYYFYDLSREDYCIKSKYNREQEVANFVYLNNALTTALKVIYDLRFKCVIDKAPEEHIESYNKTIRFISEISDRLGNELEDYMTSNTIKIHRLNNLVKKALEVIDTSKLCYDWDTYIYYFINLLNKKKGGNYGE